MLVAAAGTLHGLPLWTGPGRAGRGTSSASTRSIANHGRGPAPVVVDEWAQAGVGGQTRRDRRRTPSTVADTYEAVASAG
jgi:hypothetical protein